MLELNSRLKRCNRGAASLGDRRVPEQSRIGERWRPAPTVKMNCGCGCFAGAEAGRGADNSHAGVFTEGLVIPRATLPNASQIANRVRKARAKGGERWPQEPIFPGG
jgi:hypothetical protein